MVMKACDYNNKVTNTFSQRTEKEFNAFKNYSNVWSIYQDYDRLNETKWILTEAYRNLSPLTEKIMEWDYWQIYKSLVSPSQWNSKETNKFQKALNWYLATLENSNLIVDTNKSTDEEWYKDLTDVEQQFVKDLAKYMNDFLDPFKNAWNDNLYKIIQWCLSRWILWQNIDEKNNEKRTWLWYLFWMVARWWQWYNNIFWFLWNYDWIVWSDFRLINEDWVPKSFKIKDLYSPNNETMQEMFWLLFWDSWPNWNNPIILNPNQYRNAIKTMMKATEMKWFWWWVSSFMNWLLKWWAIWKLSSYMINLASWWAIWVSCLTTWWLNVMSYKKKNSKVKVNKALEMFWFRKEYFKLEDHDPISWLKNRLSTFYWNQIWIWQYENWPKNSFMDNVARDDDSLLNNEALSYWLMWPMNILWDTVRRWNYQQIAMDMALQELKWEWDLDNYLYYQDPNNPWKKIPNKQASITLLTVFLEKMSNITWFPEIEWWSQLNIGFEIWQNDWKLKRLAKSALWWPATVVLQMMHWMTQWATKYVNNTVHTLAWWTFNLISDIYSSVKWIPKEDLYTQEYRWPGGKWIIRKYTRWIERWWFAMSWECAREMVSKEEFWRELSRLAAWIRNIYRFWNIACRDDNWDLDWWCAWKNFLSVVYLPWQALQMAHPLIQALIKIPSDYYKYWNYFEDTDLWVKDSDVFKDSILTNFVKPMLRSMYLLKVWANAIDKTYNDELNEEWFMSNLYNAILDSTEWILYYTDDELKSYVHSYWAYWPKSYLNNDTSIFWSPLKLRDAMTEIWRIKWIESWANRWRANRFVDMFATTRMFKWFASDEWNTSLYDSWRADKMLQDWNSDDDIMTMMFWYFTDEMRNDQEFMQYVWTNLTQDRQSYWASYKDWIRNNKYNKAEIDYFETLLKKDMDEARIANPWLSDLQIYDTALKTFFEWTPLYEQIKMAVQAIDDSWDHAKAAYTDYLASAAWLQEATWVKWLALIAEYKKREYMEKVWLQYSSYATAEEKEAIKNIENIVAAQLWTWLWLADRRQYSNLMWAWFIKNHPEYEWYDPFKNLIDKDWNINMNADLKTSWTLWLALRANNLAKSEMILWNTNWYELSNVFSEKFWSCLDENWKLDTTKAAQMINMINYLAWALEDSWKSPLDISLILTPTLTKNLELFTYLLNDDSEDSKELRDKMWEEWIDQTRWILHDTYNDTVKLDEFINDYLNDANVIKTLLWKNTKWSYRKWWSLYYWNSSKKNYDYYSKPANAFNAWWSKNLSKLANGYGNSGKRSYAWNYSAREFYFLNQRSYRNNINSTRIAPDIPLTIWGFSKTTVKSKNPVSGFTTNIKPWEERSTAKFGKGKGIIWWSTTRWPVSSFKA